MSLLSLFHVPPVLLTESAAKIVRMGHLLSKKLGPEYLSTRQGPGGSKLTYLEGWRAISLANEVFGFNGWSSSVRDISIDFVGVLMLPSDLRNQTDFLSSFLPALQLDYSEETGRWNVHVTALVRVTLPDGCYHEDVGCGKMDNCKSKADALDKVARFMHMKNYLALAELFFLPSGQERSCHGCNEAGSPQFRKSDG